VERRAVIQEQLRPPTDQSQEPYFKGLLESGAFRPLIDRRYRLDQIVEAYTYVETGQKTGNVVISVAPPTS
jgi:NADPH:quinone reductase-like Zn-dependent oxidoreductase